MHYFGPPLVLTHPRQSMFPFCSSVPRKFRKHDKLLLAFCGLALAHLQGNQVPFGKIVHGPKYAITKVHLANLLPTAKQTLKAIMDLQSNSDPPPLRLSDHCAICEFNQHCHAAAVTQDDLSLLRGIREKQIIKLNNKGIFTVTQLSYTYRPRRTRQATTKHNLKHHHALQALALRTKTIYVARRPELPLQLPRLYLDIEGIPDRSFYYLIGVHVNSGSANRYHPLWADAECDEETIWNSFLHIVDALDDFTLFHYGSFDVQALKRMHRRYGGGEALCERLFPACFNVLTLIYSRVYFPTYSNGLKSIASHLGFKWTDDTATGLHTIVWRHHWENTRDNGLKQKLITYNHEDCLALEVVATALEDIGGASTSRLVASTDDIANESSLRFGRHEFFFPQLERVNRCAYFDYQRSKVYVRSSLAIQRSLRRQEHRRKLTRRPNKQILYDRPARCPNCNAIRPQKDGYVATRLVYDLRVSKDGIRRWLVRYRSCRYRCIRCKRTFLPDTYPAKDVSKYGPALVAWAVYQVIGLHNSYRSTSGAVAGAFRLLD